jgi:hypothetical protein
MLLSNYCRKLVVASSLFLLASALTAPVLADPADTAAPALDAPVVTPASALPGTYLLRYHFMVGTVHKYSTVLDSAMTMNMRGNSMPFNSHLVMTSTQTVQSYDMASDSGVITTSYTSYSGTINGQPLPEQRLSAVLSKPITLNLTSTGKIISVTGLPNTPGSSSFGSGQFGPQLPTQALNIGDSWTSYTKVPGGTSTLKTVTVLKSVSKVNGVDIGETESKFSSAPGEGVEIMDGPTGKVQLSMSGDVICDFDIDTGTINSISTDMTSTTTPVGPPSPSSIGPVTAHIGMEMTLQP